ncbi:MAG: bifunctional phosphopantothenoylcysteine decarboxylase/phosphopantothenate--cysteine ligase CoaBC [Spirochaetaceae bacterium]
MEIRRDSITGSDSSILTGRTIILALCGSVAILRSIDIARALMRHGATVVPVMSASATRLVGPDLVHWATGVPPITGLTGANEHVALAGNEGTPADLLLVAPATANTVGKIVHGIDDTPVTTVAATALGQGLPILLAPAMHEPMYTNPAIQRNLETARSLGIGVVESKVVEGKAKMADVQHIVDASIRAIRSRTSAFAGRTVLVTAGRTVEYLDPVRVVTNNSSGKMGVALARAAYHEGANVTLVYGKGTAVPPEGVRVVQVETAEQMLREVLECLSQDRPLVDVMIAAAAVGDWKARHPAAKKTATHGVEELQVDLLPTPKIIDEVRRQNPNLRLVAFRAQHDLEHSELMRDGRARMERAGADMIAINDVSKPGRGFESETNEMTLLFPDGTEVLVPMADKYAVARRILDVIATRIL